MPGPISLGRIRSEWEQANDRKNRRGIEDSISSMHSLPWINRFIVDRPPQEIRMLIDGSTWIAFAAAATLLVIFPGPNVLYIISQGVGQGRRAGVVSALGVETASIVHVLAAVFGLSALLASSASAMQAVKYAGASYFIYLGVKALRSKSHGDERPDISVAAKPLRGIYVQGMIVNLFNPKVALFFLAFLPQFVDPSRGSVPLQLLALGLTMVILGTISDLSYALISGTGRSFFLNRSGGSNPFSRSLTAGFYFVLAIVAMTTKVERAKR